VDMVVAVGGDGTINEIIQELAGTETALAVLPSGTVNVWAREMGIPLDNFGARNILLKGQVRSIDLGQVDGRYFLLMAGIGFDGEVAYAVEKKACEALRRSRISTGRRVAWSGVQRLPHVPEAGRAQHQGKCSTAYHWQHTIVWRSG